MVVVDKFGKLGWAIAIISTLGHFRSMSKTDSFRQPPPITPSHESNDCTQLRMDYDAQLSTCARKLKKLSEASKQHAPTEQNGMTPSISNFMDNMNKLCSTLDQDVEKAIAEVATVTFFFCRAHRAEFRRVYNYEWDRGNGSMGYYRGNRYYPMQMSTEQYLAIMTTIMSIPQKQIRDELRSSGEHFVDSSNNYGFIDKPYESTGGESMKGRSVEHPRGTEGPRVLIIGCGSDVPMWKALLDFLGGSVVFVDNSKVWAETCRSLGASNLHLVEYTANISWHTKQLQENLDLSTSQKIRWPTELINTDAFDVIVVDGPGGADETAFGRSQALYFAHQLALSYKTNQYTHLFLHDAAREFEVLISNKIVGHHPSQYIGNIKPRKGLKHWRIRGANKKFENM